MKKKGFTLIELLAVIVILAIIALIVTPVISRIIEKTKKEAFRQSVVGVIQSGEYYISKYLIENNGADITYPMAFTCDGESCSHDEATLTFNGATPKGGRIIVESRKEVVAEYITDGKYCASGTKWNLQVATNCSDIDTTAPVISGTLEGKVIHLSITEEESGVKGYCVNTSDDSNSCNWIDNNNKNIDHTLESAGTYYVYARDNKDNVSNMLEFTADASNFCPYEEGYEFDFAYTGGIQTFEVPWTTLYKLEVWGAQGGATGGYSVGYKVLNKGDILYVVVGGAGSSRRFIVQETAGGDFGYGGYNGGGNIYKTSAGMNSGYYTGGGGATHIATATGTLASLSSNRASILLVAGGGGGGPYGGTGGGLNGGNGSRDNTWSGQWGNGATQSSGGTSRYGSGSNITSGSFGQGGKVYGDESYQSEGGAGGGGYFGGGGAYISESANSSCGGGGGSGYIGGVPEIEYEGATYSPSTSNGGNSGNGKAKITLMEY